MPASTPIYHSADMVRELIDESRPWPRYETVYGELLVSPAPRLWHQEVVARLLMALRSYCEQVGGMHAFASPADISWSEDTLVQPDVFVVPVEEARTLDWRQVKTLLLAAEVLSPSTLRADRFTKRRLYQDRDVSLYWVIDADAHSAEIWTPRATLPVLETETLEWSPESAPEPFRISLTDLLRPL